MNPLGDHPKAGNTRSNASSEQAILDAAELLFSEKGFDAVSMSAIATLANTSKPNIYHHFSSKNDLYMAVLKAAAKRSSALLDALADAPGSFEQRLSEFSAGQLGNILAHQRTTRLILREVLLGGSERGREIAEHFVRDSFARLVDMVHAGQKVNEFRDEVDPALVAFMIVATNLFFFQASPITQYVPEYQITRDAELYNKGIMDVMFKGVLQHVGSKK